MKRLLIILTVLLAGAAWTQALAQQNATLSGVIESEEALPEGTRLAVQVLDDNDAWSFEVASVVPVGGSFELQVGAVPEERLRPFRSGAVLVPGLQNEYRVEPEGVNYAQGTLAMYVDEDGDGAWTREPDRDPFFLALSQLDQPIGFFSLIYVDQAATMSGSGVQLALEPGWNVYTARFPESGPDYAVQAGVSDITLEVLDLVLR